MLRSEIFTRRTATVIISAPEASCALTITAGDEYLPVPTISRDVKVLSAMVKLSMTFYRTPKDLRYYMTVSQESHPTAHEIDDLHLIAVPDNRLVEAARFSTTTLCSTATRRGSMSSWLSSAVTVNGPPSS